MYCNIDAMYAHVMLHTPRGYKIVEAFYAYTDGKKYCQATRELFWYNVWSQFEWYAWKAGIDGIWNLGKDTRKLQKDYREAYGTYNRAIQYVFTWFVNDRYPDYRNQGYYLEKDKVVPVDWQ